MALDTNIARVTAARFISRAGGEAAFFVGIWGKAAYELDASPGQLALLMAVMALTELAGSALSGVAVDRYGPRSVVAIGELLFVPATLALVLPESMAGMTLLVGLSGFMGGVIFTAVVSIPPFLTTSERNLERTNIAVETAGTLAFVAGPAVGAVIAGLASLDWIFVFDAATSLVAVALVVGVRIRATNRSEKSRIGQELAEGVRVSYSSRELRLFLTVAMTAWLSFGVFSSLEPFFVRDVLDAGAEALGWLNSLFGLGLFVGSLVLARLPQSFVSARTLVRLSAAGGLAAILYTGTDKIWVATLGLMIWGFLLGMQFPLQRTLVHMSSPEHLIGRIMGTMQMHHQLGHLVPLTFAPTLAGIWGPQATLVGSGVVLFLLSIVRAREAAVVDRIPRKARAPEMLEVADEPKSPNP